VISSVVSWHFVSAEISIFPNLKRFNKMIEACCWAMEGIGWKALLALKLCLGL
jgi:hypothetical protein